MKISVLKLILINSVIVFSLVACGAAGNNPTLTLPDPTQVSPTITYTPAMIATASHPTGTPTRPPNRIPDRTPYPTPVTLYDWPWRSPAPAPTNTPRPPLSADGPYLIYLTEDPSGLLSVTTLDADAIGGVTRPLPPGAKIRYPEMAISSNGEWVAFHTGLVDAAPYDLSINVMHLSDGEITKVIPLLPSDYPSNIRSVAEYELQNGDQHYYEGLSVDTVTQEIQDVFSYGIYTLGWSPDSRYLAFAGLLSGDSSNVYLYDTITQDVTRLTDGTKQIFYLEWSPDSQWLLAKATNQKYSELPDTDGYAIRIDTGEIRDWGTPNCGIEQWIGPSTYLTCQAMMGSFHLYSVDLDSQQRTDLWEYPFTSYAFDPEFDILAVGASVGFNFINSVSCLTLVYPDGTRECYVPGDWQVVFRGGARDRFVASSWGKDITIGISSDGITTTILEEPSERISISPNLEWMCLVTDRAVSLYSADDELVRQIQTWVDAIIWRPDSLGFFYLRNNILSYIDIPNGEPVTVDQNLVTDFGRGYGLIWTR